MKDTCVTCNKESLYETTEHINYRIGYIEGAGQLCLECYNDLYMGGNNAKKSSKKENNS